MSDKPEIYPRCQCGGIVFIAEGRDEGYCFDERCGLIVRRPMTAFRGEHFTLTISDSDTRPKDGDAKQGSTRE